MANQSFDSSKMAIARAKMSMTTPISGASSYREIGDFWDTHDLSEHATTEVQMDIDIQSSVIYFGLEKSLAERLRTVARDHGETPEDLLSRLVEEHVGSSK